jgi:plastocyanin
MDAKAMPTATRRSRLTLMATLVVASCGVGPPTGNATGSPGATVELIAENLAFNRPSLRVPADVVVALTLDNRDPGILHNVAIYPVDDGDVVFRGDTFTGIATQTYLFGPINGGRFRFICDVHPIMNGTLVVGDD